jgi:hypothetical protein
MFLTRREFLAGAALAAGTSGRASQRPAKRVAAVTTVYNHNSHADVILSRLLQREDLDFKSRKPDLEMVSLYVDQLHEKDLSRPFAQQYGFRLTPTIREALTLGGERLAVDGVLLVGEHGKYPESEKGEDLYPRKRFFDETAAVFRESKRCVPVFTDKHLSHSWAEAKEMYDVSRELGFPMMAGSSVPLTWRRPAVDVPRGAQLREAVGVSYHTLYGYGFHALEMLQCLAERREKGEVGLRHVQCLEGPEVWKAGAEGRYDLTLLDDAFGRLTRPIAGATAAERLETVKRSVPKPVVYLMEYRDGFRAAILTLNGAVGEWSIAWRERGRAASTSTLFWTQEARPLGHFTFLTRGIEEMIHTGKPTWPVERTLLTSGMMDRLLESKKVGGKVVETPELGIRYRPTFDWKDPGEPPTPRPLDQQ